MSTQQKYINETLEFIYKNGYNTSINEFLNETTQFISRLLKVEYVIIGRTSILKENSIDSLVFYGNKEFLPNISYNLYGTPCDLAIDNNSCIYPIKVQKYFPLDKHLVDMNIESYAGIALLSSNKNPIGILNVMSVNPLEDEKTIEIILKIIALKIEKLIEKIIHNEEIEQNTLTNKELANVLYEGILVHDNNVVLDVNETFEKMFGYKSKEIIEKKSFEEFFPKKYASIINNNDKKGAAYEIEGIKKNGNLFPIKFEYRNLKSVNNTTINICVLKDLTSNKNFEIENIKLSKAAEQSANTIVITDINGNIEYTNPKFTKTTGYTFEEVQGKNSNILSSGKHSKSFYKKMWSKILNGKNWKGEIQNKSKNGQLFWEQVNITPIQNNKKEIISFLAIKVDITERKKSEKKLKKAFNLLKDKEDYLSKILKTANEGFWIINNNNEVVKVNEKMCTILELDESEIIGKKVTTFVDEENAKILKFEVKNSAKGFSKNYEIELLKSNGKAVTCSINSSPIYNKKNEINGSFAFVTNISKLKTTNIELETSNKELLKISNELFKKNKLQQESEKKYKNLFENSPVSLIEEDFSEAIKLILSKNIPSNKLPKYLKNNRDFLIECISKIKIKRVNNSTLNLVGVKTIQELIIQLQTHNSEVSYKNYIEEIMAIILNKTEFEGETEFTRTDGKVIAVIVKYEIKPNGMVIVSAIDISAIREFENKLKKAKLKAEKSDERYKLAVSATGLGIWDWNVEKDLLYFSDYYKEQIGYKPNEFKNKYASWENHLHPDDLERTVNYLKEYFKNPIGQYNSEFRFRHKNGSYIWIYSTAEILKNKDGEVIRMFGSHKDVTIKKQALLKIEEQTRELIKAKEKAEENNRLKTEFLNNMSHEIRTPMNGILGFSQFLRDSTISNEKRNYFINIIQNSGNQLLRVIDDILEISVLETKQVKVVENPLCLNDFLFELFSIFDIKAKENQIPLYLKNALSDEESTILTDKSKLSKIISNLLDNSIKFTNKGSISFGYKRIKNKLEIFVTDTGVGINKDKQKLIFERFSQENKEASQNVGGLGLGLSIAKENSELLDGKIEVNSVKGEGATFKVTIPYKPISIKIPVINKSKAKLTKEEKKYNILIVEDEEVNYLFIEILLTENLNCSILHAKNGEEAVKMCTDNSDIDIVLMDINMPVMNGFESTKLIRLFNSSIPIIAQTAYTTQEDKEKAFEVGCNDFISKPIDKNVLSRIVNSYLSKN